MISLDSRSFSSQTMPLLISLLNTWGKQNYIKLSEDNSKSCDLKPPLVINLELGMSL